MNTLGQRIRARSARPVGNNPFTSKRDPGARSGVSTPTGATGDSVVRVVRALRGERLETASYDEWLSINRKEQ